jgi:hypothetical protein
MIDMPEGSLCLCCWQVLFCTSEVGSWKLDLSVHQSADQRLCACVIMMKEPGRSRHVLYISTIGTFLYSRLSECQLGLSVYVPGVCAHECNSRDRSIQTSNLYRNCDRCLSNGSRPRLSLPYPEVYCSASLFIYFGMLLHSK